MSTGGRFKGYSTALVTNWNPTQPTSEVDPKFTSPEANLQCSTHLRGPRVLNQRWPTVLRHVSHRVWGPRSHGAADGCAARIYGLGLRCYDVTTLASRERCDCYDSEMKRAATVSITSNYDPVVQAHTIQSSFSQPVRSKPHR